MEATERTFPYPPPSYIQVTKGSRITSIRIQVIQIGSTDNITKRIYKEAQILLQRRKTASTYQIHANRTRGEYEEARKPTSAAFQDKSGLRTIPKIDAKPAS
ncbi:hypothetical protein Nepgr_017461 [Nepenthes gracilis]|uniref:Uncharacterized protein n=1 Tax=Nepenthes gracilis TaxID=150966 RepID=A0AAD3SPG5_NEPGR|nr:hypothetical protein Nepgr_017461 [Nepenthes gracilis]